MKNAIAYLFLICIVFGACNKNDEGDTNAQNQSATVIQNGIETNITQTTGLYEYEENGVSLTISIWDDNGGLLAMRVGNIYQFSPPQDGVLEDTYYSTINYYGEEIQNHGNCILVDDLIISEYGYETVPFCLISLCTYFDSNGNSSLREEFDIDSKVVITKCNANDKTVSGNFSFTLQDFYDETITSSFEGSFNNINYIVN